MEWLTWVYVFIATIILAIVFNVLIIGITMVTPIYVGWTLRIVASAIVAFLISAGVGWKYGK